MSVAQQVGALAVRMKRAEEGAAWAKTPPPGGARGSASPAFCRSSPSTWSAA